MAKLYAIESPIVGNGKNFEKQAQCSKGKEANTSPEVIVTVILNSEVIGHTYQGHFIIFVGKLILGSRQ